MTTEDRKTHKMRFEDEQVYQIIDGRKTSEYRYDDFEDIEEGDVLIIQDMSAKNVARARVDMARTMKISEIPESVLEGHSNYEDPDDALEGLAKHYPQEEISMKSEFVLIRWELEEELR